LLFVAFHVTFQNDADQKKPLYLLNN